MSKIELSPLPSGFATTTALNARLDQIENEFDDKVLYRSNPEGEPNAMENILDMADYHIVNLPDATEDHHAVPLSQIQDIVAEEVHDQLADEMLAVGTGNVIGAVSSQEDQVALFSGITGKLLKAGQTIAQYLSAYWRGIDDVASLASYAPVAGRVYTLKEYNSGTGKGGGDLLAKAGIITPDNGYTFASATAGIYFVRINFEFLTPEHFGAIGSTEPEVYLDSTVAFTRMFNWVNTQDFKRIIIPPLKYGISAELPQLVRSSFSIVGSGTLTSQDGGTTLNHTQLAWIGASAPTSRMVLIAPVSSPSSARLDGIEFRGITIDCASGALGYGLSVKSIRNGIIDVYVKNAAVIGLQLGVVAQLGESKDLQNCRIRFIGRQLEGAGQNGVALECDGDPTANVSFNDFERIVIQSYNNYSMRLVDVDNNLWHSVSVGKTAGGSAPYSVELCGSLTGNGYCRSERFFTFSSNLPVIARATGLDNKVKGVKFYNLDKENGCPDPVVEAGAQVWWQNDDTPMYASAWAAYTPVVTSGTGAFTIVSAAGRWIRVAGGVSFSVAVTVTTNGSAGQNIRATLPIQAAVSCNAVLKGYEATAGAQAVRGVIQPSGTQLIISNDAGTYPGADGKVFILSGFYEVN